MGSLGRELLEKCDAIIDRWYEVSRRSDHPHPELNENELKDTLALQLQVIGKQLEQLGAAEKPTQMWKVSERLDPEKRVEQKVPIEDLVQDYGLLVDVVRDWIGQHNIEVSFPEYSYFYYAIFELIAESVRRFSKQQANNVARARAEYLAGLVHQMRNPLATLSLQVDLFERGEGNLDKQIVSRLRRCLKHLNFIVNGVMRLERFKPDELPVRPSLVRVAEIVNQVITDNEFEASHKNLRLDVEVNWLLKIEADADLLFDILGNLVQNAVKNTTAGFVRVEVEEQPQEICFKIKDSGPGIPADRQKKLFKLVKPGEAGGTGLGLLVAYRAVTAQGGKIGVESKPGKGTSFWFKLPRVVQARDEKEVDAG